jgi:hypothetical protein
MKTFTFEEWFDIFEDILLIDFYESGFFRDTKLETFIEYRYNQYLNSLVH